MVHGDPGLQARLQQGVDHLVVERDALVVHLQLQSNAPVRAGSRRAAEPHAVVTAAFNTLARCSAAAELLMASDSQGLHDRPPAAGSSKLLARAVLLSWRELQKEAHWARAAVRDYTSGRQQLAA